MAGIGLLLFGIIASDKKIASIRIAAFDSTVFLAVLAVPLYLILRAIQRKKRDQALHRKHDRMA
jgi:hypothetical protein